MNQSARNLISHQGRKLPKRKRDNDNTVITSFGMGFHPTCACPWIYFVFYTDNVNTHWGGMIVARAGMMYAGRRNLNCPLISGLGIARMTLRIEEFRFCA